MKKAVTMVAIACFGALSAVAVAMCAKPIPLYYVQVNSNDEWRAFVVEGDVSSGAYACTMDAAPNFDLPRFEAHPFRNFYRDGTADLFHPTIGDFAQVHDLAPASIKAAAARMRAQGYWDGDRRAYDHWIVCRA